MVERKEIPFYKIGHLLRFGQQEIEAWLKSKKTLPEIQQDRPRGIVKTTRKVKLDVDCIVSKSIAEAKRSRYNSDCGKPGQVRSLGKEVKDGAL